MKLYRIAKLKHLNDLSGQGARLYGGRWNKIGYNMLYCSTHLSLCVLEILVHMDYQYITEDYGFLEIEIPNDTKIEVVKPSILKQQWRHNPPLSFTQDYGTNWLNSQSSLSLKVPSAVLPNEFNVLINPNHQNFSKITVAKPSTLDIDSRVWGVEK